MQSTKGYKFRLYPNAAQREQIKKTHIAKVFTDTPIDESILKKPNVIYGGTGFFYDNAQSLPNEIEHHMPDYHLYDEWTATMPERETKFYREYSIGYLTRGCFRHCAFCVNRRSSSVRLASPLPEFFDKSRKKICLLDDNFFGSQHWRELLTELQATGKRFVFKQGLDARLLDDVKAELLFVSKYDGDFYFAFDDATDSPIIERKLQLIRRYTTKNCRFYLFTGFHRHREGDENFWLTDIRELLDRIALLRKYDCLAYVMRYKAVADSPHRGIYNLIAGWCNQPHLYRKISLREFANLPSREADLRALTAFETEYPEFGYYFDLLQNDCYLSP